MSEIRVDNITNEAGTGKPGFPNGITATGAALTDPEITGGIYLGGTGSANYLEDYEEGTWTPTYETSNGDFSGTMNVNLANYTKVGRSVVCNARFFVSGASGTGDLRISGLPFSVIGAQVTVSIGQSLRFVSNPPVSGYIVNSTKVLLLSAAYVTASSITRTQGSDLSGSNGQNIMSISVSYETND